MTAPGAARGSALIAALRLEAPRAAAYGAAPGAAGLASAPLGAGEKGALIAAPEGGCLISSIISLYKSGYLFCHWVEVAQEPFSLLVCQALL